MYGDHLLPDATDPRTIDAVQAARLYYFQDLTMAAIGREMGVSRSTVSRLITFARTSGLVEIKISTALGQAPGSSVPSPIGTASVPTSCLFRRPSATSIAWTGSPCSRAAC